MAALLPIDDLRRHALPAASVADLVREADLPYVKRPFGGGDVCPRLVAGWHLGPNGRPVCGWRVEPEAPDIPRGWSTWARPNALDFATVLEAPCCARFAPPAGWRAAMLDTNLTVWSRSVVTLP